MKSLLNVIDKNFERWALLVFYTMLVVTMVVEVLRREVFLFSSVWGEEIVRYSFIYLAWIGAALAVRDRAHIRIDVLFSYVTPKVKSLLYIFGDLVMFFVAINAFIWSMETLLVAWKYQSVSHGLRISMVWFQLAVPLGFFVMMIRLIQSFIRDIRDLRGGRDVHTGEHLFD